ncbi:ethanolamine ammonia-lyase light chain [Alkalispirillum mobile]|uniref:Ethanolamine ammonia-lyase small subunit n=1 Tax=Alkalispirillum mobile TaxID=85925 RepID=A0A498C8Q8_9GAMM|nr:ethanolamine ammonia-lyase subunit EutC [Alkalispirillum mobile]RLK51557.1 ethanolamine ammonia-lyase light chain [Alkalispirillum mobile]
MADLPEYRPGGAAKADAWVALQRHTEARIALGRAGESLPTRAHLDFQLAHARARDAVHRALDRNGVAQVLSPVVDRILHVSSAAGTREVFLRRPDLGRRLPEAAAARLRASAGSGCDLAIVLGDGLSARATEENGPALIRALLPLLKGLRIGPLVLAEQARVALGDPVGEALGAGQVLVLLGERPGLSAADSLGAYLTHAPRPGRQDSERNCVSNIRPGGQPPEEAAHRLAYLVREAWRRGGTGVALKDNTEDLVHASCGDDPHVNLLSGSAPSGSKDNPGG